MRERFYVRSYLCYLICWRHLIRSKIVTIRICSPKRHFFPSRETSDISTMFNLDLMTKECFGLIPDLPPVLLRPHVQQSEFSSLEEKGVISILAILYQKNRQIVSDIQIQLSSIRNGINCILADFPLLSGDWLPYVRKSKFSFFFFF